MIIDGREAREGRLYELEERLLNRSSNAVKSSKVRGRNPVFEKMIWS